MEKTLEILIIPKEEKKREFQQSLKDLSIVLARSCSEFTFNELETENSISIIAKWETADQMNLCTNSREFRILAGAIKSLCDKTSILLNDKHLGNQISTLNSL